MLYTIVLVELLCSMYTNTSIHVINAYAGDPVLELSDDIEGRQFSVGTTDGFWRLLLLWS